MIVTLEPGDFVKIQFKDTDGEFQVHFDTEEHNCSIVVKETGGMPGNIIGDARTILHHEDFSQVMPTEKTEIKKSEKMKIFVWPDNSWCRTENLEENLIAGKGDKYSIITVHCTLSEINSIVQKRAMFIKEANHG